LSIRREVGARKGLKEEIPIREGEEAINPLTIKKTDIRFDIEGGGERGEDGEKGV